MPSNPTPNRQGTPNKGLALIALSLLVVLVALFVWEWLQPRPTVEKLAGKENADVADADGWHVVEGVRIRVKEGSNADTEDRENQRRRDLCHIKDVCSAFASARQECAVAGDFNRCLDIKLGHDLPFVSYCSADGELVNTPSDLPNSIQCIALELEDWVGAP